VATLPRQYLTPEQYLEIERKAETKSEYYRGEMFAMAGGSRFHSVITVSLGAILHRQLRHRDCSVCSSDLRVLVSVTGLYTYPDVTVFCGQPQFHDAVKDTLLNPVLVAEVLSPSTEAYDRGRKFEHYRGIESLQHYLLVAPDRMNADLFTLEDGRWILTSANRPEEVLRLDAIGCEVPIGELYEKVEFPPEPPPPDDRTVPNPASAVRG
jgi:Uma2 family endonuclease